MNEKMDEMVGKIIKSIAWILLFGGILASLILAIKYFGYGYDTTDGIGAAFLLGGPVVAFVLFAFVYGFGKLVDNAGNTYIPAPQSGGSAYGYAPQNRGSAFSPAPQNGGGSYRPAPNDDTYRVGGFQFKKEDGYSVIIGVTGTPQGVLSVPAAFGGSDVTAIGNFAFSKCTDIKRVEIPNSVKSIGGSAFSGCTGLDSVSIPESVESIGSEIFSGCASLKEIKVREGSYAQKWCTDNGFSDKIVTY